MTKSIELSIKCHLSCHLPNINDIVTLKPTEAAIWMFQLNTLLNWWKTWKSLPSWIWNGKIFFVAGVKMFKLQRDNSNWLLQMSKAILYILSAFFSPLLTTFITLNLQSNHYSISENFYQCGKLTNCVTLGSHSL